MNKKISKTIYDFVLEWDGPVPVPTGPTPKICTFLKKCLYGQKYTVATLFVAMPLDMANSMGLYVVIPEKPYKTVNGQICVKSNNLTNIHFTLLPNLCLLKTHLEFHHPRMSF